MIKIGVLKEQDERELRVSLSPEGARKLMNAGYELYLEEDAGVGSSFSNSLYEGAHIEAREFILSHSSILLSLSPLSLHELDHVNEGTLLIGLFKPHKNQAFIDKCKERDLLAFSLELLPRITRSQTMDVLSSQSNLAGYRSVIETSYHLNRVMPLMMTAAGTLKPCRVCVLGAGVAGLQAIATAKRLGAIVLGYDVRLAAKEQVESLGARFIEIPEENSLQTQHSYAKETDESYRSKQRELLASILPSQDIVITTAQIPGKPSPILITQDMVESMQEGSIILDLAGEGGGNCALSKFGHTINHQGVTLMTPSHILSSIAHDASTLYARNIVNFIKNLTNENTDTPLNERIRFEDELVQASCISRKNTPPLP